MDHDTLDAGRPGSRRSVENPELLVGKIAVQAMANSPLMANLRELGTRIVKDMESSVGQSTLRAVQKGLLSLAEPPVLSTFGRHVLSRPILSPRTVRQLREAGELLEAIDAFQRGEKDPLWRWVEERNGSTPDTILAARFSKDVPPVRDADVGTMIAFSGFLADGHRRRMARGLEAKVIHTQSTELRWGIKSSYASVEYALARLARRGETTDDVLRNGIPGEAYLQAAELPPKGNLAGETASGIRRWIERPDRPNLVVSTDITPDDALSHVDELELAAFAMRELLERCAHDAGLSRQESESFFFGQLFGNTEAAVILNRPAEQIGVEKFRARQKLRAAAGL